MQISYCRTFVSEFKKFGRPVNSWRLSKCVHFSILDGQVLSSASQAIHLGRLQMLKRSNFLSSCDDTQPRIDGKST